MDYRMPNEFLQNMLTSAPGPQLNSAINWNKTERRGEEDEGGPSMS